VAASTGYVLRAQREHSTSKAHREKAQEKLKVVNAVTERIKRMTRIYQERLEGKRTDD
jgi:hypothetical protein